MYKKNIHILYEICLHIYIFMYKYNIITIRQADAHDTQIPVL